MGLVSYRNYWRLVLCYQLRNQKKALSVEGLFASSRALIALINILVDISNRTGMTADDIICALEGLHAIVRDPITGTYALRLDYSVFQAHIDKWEAKGYVKLNPKALVWTPFIMGRGESQGPALATVAPREDAEADVPAGAEDPDSLHPEANSSMQIDADTGHSPAKRKKHKPEIIGDGDGDGDLEMKMEDNGRSAEIVDHTVPTTDVNISSKTPPASGKSPYLIKLGHELDSPISHMSPTAKSVPYAESHSTDDAYDIPPTRFEIYPPLPGSAPRSRARERGGVLGSTIKVSRKRTMSPAVTPARPTTTGRSNTARGNRTRSSLTTDTVKVMERRSMSAREEDSAPDTPTTAPSMEDIQHTAPSLPQPKFGGLNSQDSGVETASSTEPPLIRGKVPRASYVV